MDGAIKIIHIDGEYRVVYVLIKEGAFIKSTVPLEAAVTMLKNEQFDLILSEPQNMAIVTSLTLQRAIKK